MHRRLAVLLSVSPALPLPLFCILWLPTRTNLWFNIAVSMKQNRFAKSILLHIKGEVSDFTLSSTGVMISIEKQLTLDAVTTICTFNFTLSLAAQAGLSLKHIAIYPLVDTKIMTGLTNAVGLVAWKSALLRVETLELAFVNDRRDGVRSADEA
jgi:hypothetical protein